MSGTSIGAGSMYAPGQIVSDAYRITKLLGKGGMGAVYEAHHIESGNTYALKTLFSQFIGYAGYAERFDREARVMANLTHPNIVEIIDYDVDNVPFIVMERLLGMDLTDRIKEAGFLTFSESLEILTPIANALEFAHSKRPPIVHRDLKPDNIFLCDNGTVKLLDFGIAKILRDKDDEATVVTMVGSTMGTMNFMSPEQARGDVHEIDQRTDVFALGAIMYQMLSGKYAFNGDVATVMFKILNEDPTPLDKLVGNVPAGVQDVIDRALAKDKFDRYPRVSGFLADLQRIDQGMHPTPIPKAIEPVKRTKNNGRLAEATLNGTSTSDSQSDITLPPRYRRSRAGLYIFLGTLAVGGGAAASYFTNTPPQFKRFIDKNIKKLRGKTKQPPKPKPMKVEPKEQPRSKARPKTRRRSSKRKYYRRGSRRR